MECDFSVIITSSLEIASDGFVFYKTAILFFERHAFCQYIQVKAGPPARIRTLHTPAEAHYIERKQLVFEAVVHFQLQIRKASCLLSM